MKLKKFIDIYIPTTVCNLKCSYCYISQLNQSGNKVAKFKHTPEEIQKALSVERLGGICMLNMCAGGETLLSEEILPIARALCEEGHYVMIVTNGTVGKRFQEIEEWSIEQRGHLFFKFSLHYLELKRLNLLENFANNVKKARKLGCSITVEITPNDELIPYIEELKDYCLENFSALCHCTIARDDRKKGIDILSTMEVNEYKQIWEQFDSDLFKYKMSLYKVKRKEFCYAGVWSFYLNLETGDVRQCYCGSIIDNIYRDVSKPIRELPIGKNCSLAYCYNGHAFMAFGNIPGLDNITYAQLRDRMLPDNTSWLEPQMREIMECKLQNNNTEYSNLQKKIVSVKSFLRKNIYVLNRVIKKYVK